MLKLFANGINGQYLENILPGEEHEIDWVKAAIAYGNDSTTLIKNCLSHRRRLDIYMRYDHTVPVHPELLQDLLKKIHRNIFCYLVPDVLHSKVIWWKGYGVYIGSANLTERAWKSNIEAGVFIPEEVLDRGNFLEQIYTFFEELSQCNEVFPLSEEIIEEQKKIKKSRAKREKEINDHAESLRSIKRWEGPTFTSNEMARERSRERFLREWNEGIVILRAIAERAPEFRPRWLDYDVPRILTRSATS